MRAVPAENAARAQRATLTESPLARCSTYEDDEEVMKMTAREADKYAGETPARWIVSADLEFRGFEVLVLDVGDLVAHSRRIFEFEIARMGIHRILQFFQARVQLRGT